MSSVGGETDRLHGNTREFRPAESISYGDLLKVSGYECGYEWARRQKRHEGVCSCNGLIMCEDVVARNN